MKLSYSEEYYNNIYYNPDEDAYELECQVGNQTIWMQFGLVNFDREEAFVNTFWFNVALSIYNKTKDMYTNMDKKLSTGMDPVRNFLVARKMYDALEATVVEEAVRQQKDVIIFCHWMDNRRRDAYYRVLSKKGYRYGRAPWTTKVIMKKFKWKDYKEMVENEEF
ncbi:MAG: hypothetical protein J5666_05500 [Bacilli bacterium]|nr:hypothetical protein [Bacilli bacterium]